MSLIVFANADDHHVHGVFTSIEKIRDVIERDLIEYGTLDYTYRYCVHNCTLDKDFDDDPIYFMVHYKETGEFAFCIDTREFKKNPYERNPVKWTDTLNIQFD